MYNIEKHNQGDDIQMSLKKSIFRSNMKILFLALVSLMLVAVLIIELFEDAILKDFESMNNAQLNPNVSAVVDIVGNDNFTDFDELEQKTEEYGYELIVIDGDKIVHGKNGRQEKDLLAKFDMNEHINSISTPEIFYFQKITAVGKYAESTGEYVMAVHFFEGEWWFSSFKNSFSTFVAAFIITCLAVIGVLLLLSSFFTKRMVRKIVEPLDALVDGAERIKDGNLTQPIVYKGDGEFEEVCSTFNAMQNIMLEDKEQHVKNEKDRTDMITGISHDLRTPLTSIRGYIKGVLDGVADTPQKKTAYLKTAYESTDDMNTLLQKLFDFSRLESGQMPLHLVTEDLAEFTSAYAAQKEIELDNKNTEISLIKRENTISEIQMDVEQIRRIFDNLLENSIKYAQVSPLKIIISIFEDDSNVIMEWHDNGQGVPENMLDKIFERFYRCDEARSKKGSGVGLYVVKYIATQHGAEIDALNNNGFCVRISFPKA